MQEFHHGALDEIVHELVTMSDAVQVAVRDATRALLEADASIAERVISDDARIDTMHDQLEQRCFSLLARSTPVAGELRTIVAAMQVIADIGRTGDLAAHVAEIARMRYPEHAVPAPLVPNFTRMSQVAQEMVGKAGRTLLERDPDAAAMLASEDDEMDELRSEQFRLIASDDWTFGVEAAVDTALLGRYYERIADHAVAMGGRIIYVITGEAPEGEDWPTT
ncbi:Phosphate transport system protein PhoU [Propionibacterium ruminifibrarum]|uniref:Phosphate-specific transport system accessory protein PhoU n=1 Tax=Propionibacterium ruminifibrarum TaxID=1962131 RepID=A0A375I4J6_9ACTN|nr:phosphate signaling complex protein PhoU [Propionibacterium ruminifibrarum]SPF68148.1 Phosphate transport system protein PhoU [Propionibacterium ruminifibrarum]